MIQNKIVLLEDEEAAQVLFSKYLKSIGYPDEDIIICSSYAELRSVDGSLVDIIITDLGLPDSPAAETFGRVKKLFPYTPIIVVTGNSEKSVAVDTIEQGADDYLVKGSITKDTVERAIRYAKARRKISVDYRKLFQESPAPMYIYDMHTFRMLAVNTAALTQYGYTREEFLAIDVTQIRPHDEVQRFHDTIRDVPDTYFNFGRWRHTKKNGEIFYVNIYAHIMEFEGKKASLVMAVDIDKTVKAELELQRRVHEKEVILESITNGFFTVNKQHRFTYVNSTFEKIMQKSKADVVGRKIFEVFPEALPLKFYSQYQKAVIEQKSVHFEEYFPPLQIWLWVNAYPSEEGLTVFMIDITQQKNMQEAIYFNELNLRAIINNTSDFIWSVDRHLNFITANKLFYTQVLQQFGDAVTSFNKHDFPEPFYEEWMQYYNRAFGGQAFRIIRQVTESERLEFQEVNFNPIRDDSGEVIGISCFARDITEQQQHLQMIEQQNQHLRKIAWIQSHEMRRPVANILGLVSLIENKQLNDQENQEIIHHLKTSAHMLDELIRKITDLADNMENNA